MGNASSDPTTWTIDSQAPRMGQNARGQYVDGYQVEFTTGMGNRGVIFVPRERYNPANVVALVKAHASELDTVSRSGG